MIIMLVLLLLLLLFLRFDVVSWYLPYYDFGFFLGGGDVVNTLLICKLFIYTQNSLCCVLPNMFDS